VRGQKGNPVKTEEAIGNLLREKGWTLAVAESCTGGLISDRITNVPGSSDYFAGGMVTYTIEAKARHLGIPVAYIRRHGVVSSEVARRMARGVKKAFKTDLGLSTTGVAGPGGGTSRTPVGTVFIGIAFRKGTCVKRGNLKGSRRKIKEEAAEMSLKVLLDRLKQESK
jgi:nicotinamide-nucleotide amidase